MVVWCIDRLGIAALELLKRMLEFREKGVEFRSLTEGIDTTTPMGRIWLVLSAVFAENKREIIRERSKAGVETARAREKAAGRPKGLTKVPKEKALTAAILYKEEVYPK